MNEWVVVIGVLLGVLGMGYLHRTRAERKAKREQFMRRLREEVERHGRA